MTKKQHSRACPFKDDTFFTELRKLDQETNAADGAPAKEIRLLRESPYLDIVLPDGTYDFKKANTGGMLYLLRKFGRASGAIGRIFEGHINALFLLHLYATEEQQQFYYQKVKQDHALLGVWNTDAHRGIVYRKVGAHIDIQGAKAFCSGANFVDYAVIGGTWENQAKADWQLSIIPMEKVPESRIDLSSWKTLGMRSSVSFTVDFSSVSIPVNALLGGLNDYTKNPFFLGGAIRFAAVHLGMAEAIMTATLQYLADRSRTDQVFQRMRLGQMEMAIRTGQLWLKDAGGLFDKTLDNPHAYGNKLVSYAHMTRLVVEEISLKVMELSSKSIGAQGLFSAVGIEQLHRDLAFYLRQPAPDETLQNAAAFVIASGQEIVDIYDDFGSETY